MTIEGNTQHGDSQEECCVLTFLIQVVVGLIDGPDDDADEQEDIDNLARIERHAQDVDEQQFEPTAHLYDTWNDAIKNGSQDDYRQEQGKERTFQIALGVVGGELAIVVNQYDGWQTEQVQQVDTNGEARHIHN